MKTIVRSLPWAFVCPLFLSACQSLPQASLVYASRQTLGINISTPSQAQPEPLSFTLGFGNQDLAYVPIIADGCKVLDADYQRNLSRDDRNGDKDKRLADCLRARAGKPAGKPEKDSDADQQDEQPRAALDEGQVGKVALMRVSDTVGGAESKKAKQEATQARPAAITPYDLLHKDGNAIKIEDASSVLGTFGSGVRAGNVENTLGKFFSTGVAAQQLAEGFAYKHAAEGYALYITALSKCVDDLKQKLPKASDSDVLVICSSGFSKVVKAAVAESAPETAPEEEKPDPQEPATPEPTTAFRLGGVER